MTGTQIINAALTEIGVLAAGESPTTADSTFVLEKLNRLFNSWNVRRLFIYVMNHVSYAFGVSQQSYTIGPSGADITADRPIKIERANIVLVATTPNLHIPLSVLNTHDYATLSIPALSATYPTRLYYQPTVTKGTLWPWPYPTDVNNKLELFTWNQLSQISAAGVGNDYALPPGYEEALIYSLAETLCPAYGKQLTPELMKLGREARAAVMGINSAPPKLNLDIGGTGGRSGGYSRSDFLTGGFG